jgi:hypothetical protein
LAGRPVSQPVKLGFITFMLPILPQIGLASCNEFITTCVSVLVSTGFAKTENESAPGEVFLWGHQADRRPAVKTLTNEASIEGRFRFAGKKPDL